MYHASLVSPIACLEYHFSILYWSKGKDLNRGEGHCGGRLGPFRDPPLAGWRLPSLPPSVFPLLSLPSFFLGLFILPIFALLFLHPAPLSSPSSSFLSSFFSLSFLKMGSRIAQVGLELLSLKEFLTSASEYLGLRVNSTPTDAGSGFDFHFDLVLRPRTFYRMSFLFVPWCLCGSSRQLSLTQFSP